jgi:two-component system sensor histidine kinase KdpD
VGVIPEHGSESAESQQQVPRGRLKIFLGYASRVGKSFRMLDEGRRRKERGQDVVVGATQLVRTVEVEALLAQLESVPMLAGAGGRCAINVVELCRRHPQVCLIDELAHDNPPESHNPKRWQDVTELLDRGINVITAVNIHHIEEQQATVERITGKQITQTVPEAFVREAEEIELVDAAPQDLAVRQGPEAAPDVHHAAELRELALLLAADVVDHQLRKYLDSHSLRAAWGTHERILVCLTPGAPAAEMLASGRRNADRFHGELLACSLGQGNGGGADPALNMAREARAELHVLKGNDFVDAVLKFAREQRITQLFVAHNLAHRRSSAFRVPVDRLIREAEEFDIRLFPHA